jgi:hypothetical protein
MGTLAIILKRYLDFSHQSHGESVPYSVSVLKYLYHEMASAPSPASAYMLRVMEIPTRETFLWGNMRFADTASHRRGSAEIRIRFHGVVPRAPNEE